MTDPEADIGTDEPVETDPEALSASEDFDEDALGRDPTEANPTAASEWSEAERLGTTAEERRQGESLDERLAQELPDFGESST